MMKIIHIGITIEKRKLAKRNRKVREVGVQSAGNTMEATFVGDIGSSRSCWRYREFEKRILLFFIFFKLYDYLSISKENYGFVNKKSHDKHRLVCYKSVSREGVEL